MDRPTIVACEINRLRWGERTTLLVLEVKLSNGLSGLGEASMSGDDIAAGEFVRNIFTKYLEDRLLDDIDFLVDTLGQIATEAGSFAEATAASALEQSLWDIKGQMLNVPIYSMIGDIKTNVIPLYANINRVPGDRTPDAFAREALAANDAGFSAIKCAPFDEVYPPPFENGYESLLPGLRRVAAMRSALGSRVEIMVDCHGRLGRERAMKVLDELFEVKIKWLEEPVITNNEVWRVIRKGLPEIGTQTGTDIEGLRFLAGQSKIKLAAGEFEVGLDGFERLLSLGALDFIMPDVKYCGGIRIASEIVKVAAANNVRVSPHNPSGPVSTLVSAHVAAVSPTLDSLEIAWSELFPDRGLVDPPLNIEKGKLTLSDHVGLGVRLVPCVVDRLRIPFR